MDAPRDEDANQKPIVDISRPLAGVVICCTAIPPERRTELEKQIRQLGGIHTYDLVVDVTHLIVGNYDTPKYRHVAKDRHDVKVMDGVWIEALTDLWTRDAPIDFAAVEAEWRLLPLETNGPAPGDDDRGRLACSISGFHDLDERQLIIDRIVEAGGIYLADLDRKNVTHLIVNEPKGNKFEAARKWGMHTVSLAWLDQSIERGMILDEELFDPILPPEEQGRHAWLKPHERHHLARAAGAGTKRSLSAVEPGPLSHEQRKLRKTTSMKLGGQRDNIWGDIMANNDSSARTVFADDRIEVVDSAWDLAAKHAPPEAVFSACCFFIAGFDQWQFDIMTKVIRDLGGAILDEMDDFSMIQDGGTRRCLLYVVVPQTSRPETHPEMPPPGRLPVRKVTEFFIERCLHAKVLFDPLDHVLGRPFPHWPLDGFEGLTMGTSGFVGIDLLHVEKCVRCMGARYAPRLNESVSILICLSLESTRKDKIKLAMENGIPIVSADWLWSCVAAGTMHPVKDFLFPSLRQDPTVTPRPRVANRPKTGGGLESTAQPGTVPGSVTRPESRDKKEVSKVVALAVEAPTASAVAVPKISAPPVPAPTTTPAATIPAPSVPAPAATIPAPSATASTTAPVASVSAPNRKGQFVDRSAFADDGPAKTAAKPEPVKFPSRDTFGSGIVLKPARTPSMTSKSTASHEPAGKPQEPKPALSEPIQPEPVEVAKAPEPDEPTSPAAPPPEDEPDQATDMPPSPPRDPSPALAQPDVKRHSTEADQESEDEKHDRRRDEDQRAAERAAMASNIMASKLNSLAGAKAADHLGDEEGGAKPTRRRKGIFGRAISNVSAASSGSHDSGQQQQQQNAALSTSDEGLLRSRSNGSLFSVAHVDAPQDQDDLDNSALPSTQIGWNDEAGALRKAEVLRRLMVDELGPDAVLPPIPQPAPRKRMPSTTNVNTTTTMTTRVTRRSARR
ncbi:BRCA1 C terminus domain-containing protein [Plectosphaerella plurivora]|uniref:BRCA1 C terminus domain-containing protein n=1 Tax=Plectosphaerella plurivora TaxID=936078 RepID=A0A9P8V3M7_9PEZI|nr:BRCA1 C terminus domain-containing protein [Plectosphaerella plurivora]